MSTITITAGRPIRPGDEKEFSGADGTYTVTLVAVTEPVTAKSNLADAKGDGTWTYRDWTFAIEPAGEVIDVRVNARSAGPKSRQFGIIAALVGRTPTVGAEVDIQKHLIGRQCLVSIRTNDNDFPYVEAFMSLPPGKAAPAPVPEPVVVAAATAPTSPDDLPF
jgi:hypothetical protein